MKKVRRREKRDDIYEAVTKTEENRESIGFNLLK